MAQEGGGGPELLARVESTTREAATILAGLEAKDLLQRRQIQGVDVTVLEAIYHVAEHFSAHVGQVVYITKLRTGRDLALIRIYEDGTSDRSWLPPQSCGSDTID